jgi:hypothetical protein
MVKIKLLQKSEMIDGKLLFDNGDQGFKNAIEDGIFLIRIPSYLSLTSADTFAKNFYKDLLTSPNNNKNKNKNKYYGYKSYTSENFGDPLLGFHKRKDQIEQFLLEKRFWKKCYPSDVIDIGEYLCKLSSEIITNIFLKTGLPTDIWEKATGGCSHGKGSYHLTFNHFRPEKVTKGLSAHKDDGFITILRSNKPGLEIYKNETWIPLIVSPQYFIINFGLSMEILTKEAEIPVSAITHRVVQQKQTQCGEDRWSWGLFSSSHFDEKLDLGIYSYSSVTGQLKRLSDSREHIERNDIEIYR